MVSSGLTVGLSVGIPSVVIIAICGLVWWLNQRKQQKEDLTHDAIDLELKDEHLFINIQNELLQPYIDPSQRQRDIAEGSSGSTGGGGLVAGEKDSNSRFNDSSHSSSSVTDQPSTPSQPPRTGTNNTNNYHSANQRTPSSYDFYETFIPILPNSASKTTSSDNFSHSHNPSGDLTQPPTFNNDGTATPTKNNSSSSIVQLTNSSKSLDNLAKQLNLPAFFEKLPSRTGTVISRQQQSQQHQFQPYRNLTLGAYSVASQLILGSAGGDRSRQESSVSGSEVGTNGGAPSTTGERDSVPLGKVLGGNFDNSFNEQSSPFEEESADEGVANGVIFK